MANSKIFSVIALKGGVGKTTVVANLGAALAEQFGKRVLIVDANFSTPHLGIHVGLIEPEHNLHQVLLGQCSVYEAIYEHPIGFHIIPGKLAPQAVDCSLLKERLIPLIDNYDVILIDSSPALNQEMLAAMEAADEIIVVSSPDYPTLSSTLHAVDIARRDGTKIRGLVMNKVRNKNFELKSSDISGASETKILASLPDDIKVLSALSKMVPVVSDSPKVEISHIFKKLAGSLVGENYRKGILFGTKPKGKKRIQKKKAKKEAAKKEKVEKKGKGL